LQESKGENEKQRNKKIINKNASKICQSIVSGVRKKRTAHCSARQIGWNRMVSVPTHPPILKCRAKRVRVFFQTPLTIVNPRRKNTYKYRFEKKCDRDTKEKSMQR
jgi:hypothetical protein